MGYLCKTCLRYQRDKTDEDEGWRLYGWQSKDRCGACTPADDELVESSAFVRDLRERVKDLRIDRDRIIERFWKNDRLRKAKYCEHCLPIAQQLASLAESLREARRKQDEAMENWVSLLLKYECKDEEPENAGE